MIRDYHAEGRLDQLDPTLLADSLEQEDRDGLGHIHPTFMGGEYLPPYEHGEVEIARIELESTTSDVISVRARPCGSRILYRISDEFETEYELPQKSSRRPFSLGEFIRFLDAVEQVGGEAEPVCKRFGFVLSFNVNIRWTRLPEKWLEALLCGTRRGQPAMLGAKHGGYPTI
jgi:hypothetical protein